MVFAIFWYRAYKAIWANWLRRMKKRLPLFDWFLGHLKSCTRNLFMKNNIFLEDRFDQSEKIRSPGSGETWAFLMTANFEIFCPDLNKIVRFLSRFGQFFHYFRDWSEPDVRCDGKLHLSWIHSKIQTIIVRRNDTRISDKCETILGPKVSQKWAKSGPKSDYLFLNSHWNWLRGFVEVDDY